MSYYSDLDNHIRDKVKVVLNIKLYQIMPLKKELEHTKGVDTSDLADKKILLL